MSVNTALTQVARATTLCAFALGASLASALLASAHAADATTIDALRGQIEAMRQEYEARLQALEARLDQAQREHHQAQQATPPSVSSAIATPPVSQSPAIKDNRFNPAISLILSGTYANLSKSPEGWQMSGFVPGGDELGPGSRSFSLGESELNFSANIDSWLYGSLTLAVTPEDSIETEEAFIQTTALPGGLTLKAGRFFGGLGYLNEQHAHTWDFVDAPLTHQAFFGGQYRQEGVQARWLAPTDHFIELGMELGNGHGFPGSERGRNGLGALALSARTGGDIDDSHNWRAGVSWLRTQAREREWEVEEDAFGNENVMNGFTGLSRLWVIDGVWKWAPQGNAKRTSFKLQGEYFRRAESGALTYDVEDTFGSTNTDAYRSAQSGWYLQGVYQFAPGWRIGLRHDQLDPGTIDLMGNASNLLVNTDHKPQRHSVMLDWGPSEFQRWRVQLSQDRVREGVKDTQFFLKYQVHLGAHGAHSY